jgi:formylglycine-generating enzyme required for sulfatase activity
MALKALESLEYDPFLKGRIVVETVAWDKPGADTPMLATMTPQEAISEQRPKPSDCDIVIVIFWSRMGTPLPPEYVKPEDGKRYLSGTEWEYLDAFRASQQKGRPTVLVYHRTEAPRFAADDPEIEEKLKQWQLVKTFFDSFRNPDDSIRSGINEYDTPDTFEKKLSGHLREIIHPLLTAHEAEAQVPDAETPSEAPPPERTHEPPLWEGSPFPGLRAFTEADAPIYFGRGRETDGLIRRLADGARFLTVVGVSGSGKSSLVAAGLLPRLKDNAIPGSRDWVYLRFTPGGSGSNPFLALASLFKPALLQKGESVSDVASNLKDDPATLKSLVAMVLEGEPKWSELLLFIDQFEELFTVVDNDFRAAFSGLLAAAAKEPRLRLVLTLRADFYHRAVEQPPLAECLRTGSYPLAAPGIGALYEMITRPAARAGLSFEESLPDRVLDDTGQEPGALPLMAFALEQLYLTCAETRELTVKAYETFGGVQGAIGERAEETFAALDKGAKAAFDTVFRELIEVDSVQDGWVATRKRARQADFASPTEEKAFIDAFLRARLLIAGTDSDNEPVVEVAHEALLSNWPKLVTWIKKNGEDLLFLQHLRRDAIEAKKNEYRADLLWPRRRWRQADRVLARLQKSPDELDETEATFLTKSRNRTRRQRVISGVAFGFGILVLSSVALGTRYFGSAYLAFDVAAIDGEVVSDYRVSLTADAESTDYSWVWWRRRFLTPNATYYVKVHVPGYQEWNDKITTPTKNTTNKHKVSLVPNDSDRNMVRIEPGCFTRGSDKDDIDEHSAHEVCLSKPFRIGRTEVTFAEFDRFAEATGREKPSDKGWGRGSRPVINVSWNDAVAYTEWLSEHTDKRYRLPSESEWEYVARAGMDTKYWWGDDVRQDEEVWANCAGCGSQWDGERTAPACSFEANAFGLYDTAGNVWEWVQDCWHDSYEGSPDDGSAWEAGGDCDRRVIRGGSWNDEPWSLRSAFRYWFGPDFRTNSLGFRLAQDVE